MDRIQAGAKPVKRQVCYPDTRLIRKVLIDLGLRVADLPIRTGYSLNYVSYLINGRRTAPTAQARVAWALHCPAVRLFHLPRRQQ